MKGLGFGHLLGWKRYADIPTAVGDTGLVAFGFKRKNGIERRWRFQSNCHRGVEVLCNHAAKVAAIARLWRTTESAVDGEGWRGHAQLRGTWFIARVELTGWVQD